jgi:SSS family solute:Na+ symporter
MSRLDWSVLSVTLLSIVSYGLWKSRGAKNIESFLLGDKQSPWYHIGLSVMATQASAITFISEPGLAYSDGMRFVQFYFGLPLAMIVICITFIPIFHKLKVFTAYEFLEKRFDCRTRLFTAFLFLVQRGLSTGLTIYAPAIILSGILHIDISYTTILMGTLVILYTVYGGTKAVSYTQLLQMGIIFAGLLIAGFLIVHLLPSNIGFSDALHIAGKMGKLNVLDTKFDLNNRYNIWSGLIGGFFLQLSYFGTDQSQVGRYLTAKSIAQSRLGLLFNGLIKIPMQFLILLLGTLVFSFYQFHPTPVFFNKTELNRLENSSSKEKCHQLETDYTLANTVKQKYVENLADALHTGNEQALNAASDHLQEASREAGAIRKKVIELMVKNNSGTDTNDSNYIFLSFITQYLPKGLIGLLIAIIFIAAMGSTASGLNALASTTVIDFYKRLYSKEASPARYLAVSRWATVAWGIFCIFSALFLSRLGNLIEAVNILGSLFYGTILGIFLVAFYMRQIKGRAVFYAALLTEVFIIFAWLSNLMAFLWLNAIGCLLVMIIAAVLQRFSTSLSSPPQ